MADIFDTVRMRHVGLTLAVAISAVGMASCGGDSEKNGGDDETVLCGQEECTADQKCDEAAQKCVPKEDVKPEHNCGDIDCDLETQICTDDKKCEPKPADEDKCNAGEDKCNPDGSCVDILSNNDHCGACNAKCEGTCTSGTCEDNGGGGGGGEDACKEDEEPTCDGNAVKKCVGGEYKTESCSDLEKCEGGVCKEDPTKCNPEEFEASCKDNAVVKCEGGTISTTDCGSKTCENGDDGVQCSQEDAQCKADDPKTCNEDNTILNSCENGQWVPTTCPDGFVCGDGENGKDCVAKEAVCNDEDPATCDESGQIKTCENGQWKLTPCENADEICEGEGQCAKIEVKLCPDNGENGKQTPGACGCSVPDTDLNNNGVFDCLEQRNNKELDLCPDDPKKTLPGVCGCGVEDIEDGNSFKCLTSKVDFCPNDDNKTLPGVCGCNHPDTFDELMMMPWCNGYMKNDKHFYSCLDNVSSNGKYLDGICGCGATVEDEQKLGDNGLPECATKVDNICPTEDQDPSVDTDKDGVPDCLDQCPENEFSYIKDDICSCNEIHVVIDGQKMCAIPIRTADEFVKIVREKDKVNWPNTDKTVYALMYDIDLGDAIGHVTEADWMTTTFKGKLVSTGKKISFTKGDKSRALLKCTNTSSCGLFNGLGASARIHNIKLDFDIVGTSDLTGMLAGTSGDNASISNIDAVGNVKGGKGNDARVGGVIGYANKMTVANISHDGNVESVSKGTHVGGVFGRLNGKSTVSGVHQKGDVIGNGNGVGGVFGRIDGAIANDISFSGNVTSTAADFTGGIAGYSLASMTKVVSEGKVVGHQKVGGCFGYQANTMTDVTNKAEVEAMNDTLSWGLYEGGVVGQQAGGFVHEKLRNEGKVFGDCVDRDYLSSGGNKGKHADTCSMVGGIFGVIENNNSKGSVVKDAENIADITAVAWHDGISKWNGYRTAGIAGFAYTTQFENVKNSGTITGGSETGGIVGRYDMIGTAANRGIEFKIENAVNTGKVTGKFAYHGGIAGYYILRDQNAKMELTNCTNSGDIDGTSYQGGMIGLFRQNSQTTLTDMYSTGNVTGTATRVGGIIGSVHPNDDWTYMQGTAKRTIALNLNRCAATGNVSGTTEVGGLLGIVDGNLHNRNLSKTNNTYVRRYCPTDKTYFMDEFDWQYLDLTYNVQMLNIYSTGKVEGTKGNVGGFIGYIVGNSNKYTPDNTFYSYSSDGKCKLTKTYKPAQTITRITTLVIANAFAAGQVVSKDHNVNTAGMIGNVNYSNGLGAKYNYLFNNMYATGVVEPTSGIFLGAKPNTSTVTFKNSYYWPDAGSDKVVGAGAIDIQNIFPFTYNSGVPYINDTDKLLDKLNSNYMSSTSPELNSDVSSKWFDKDFSLTNNMTVTIPMFDFPKKAEDDNNNNNNNNNDDENRP